MHKRIWLVENIAHMAEHKYASINFPSLYFDVKRRADSLKFAHDHFKSEFMKRLGVKYFIPDPINGGNSNTGPQIKRILKNISVSASIFNISPTTLYLVGKCCECNICESMGMWKVLCCGLYLCDVWFRELFQYYCQHPLSILPCLHLHSVGIDGVGSKSWCINWKLNRERKPTD